MMDFFKFSYFHTEVLSDDMMDLHMFCLFPLTLSPLTLSIRGSFYLCFSFF